MKKFFLLLVLLSVFPALGYAEPKKQGLLSGGWLPYGWKGTPPQWSKDHDNYTQMKRFHPYLEDSRHVQIPQWDHQDWYLEDWHKEGSGMDLVKGFYKADIFRDQNLGQSNIPRLVVGPNFYHLSGFDKRRVVATLDRVYGMTKRSSTGVFYLEDWNSQRPVGVYDRNGLRLH